MGVELKINIDELTLAKTKFSNTADGLVTLKDGIESSLTQLRTDWNTPAGVKFFETQDCDWTPQVQKFIDLTKAAAELLQSAINSYQTTIDAADAIKF